MSIRTTGSWAPCRQLVTASLLALVALALGSLFPARADTPTTSWSGTLGTDWANAGNWSSGVPSAALSGKFDAVFANPPGLTAGSFAQGLWLATGVGQDVTISAGSAQTLTLNGDATLTARPMPGSS